MPNEARFTCDFALFTILTGDQVAKSNDLVANYSFARLDFVFVYFH